MDNGKQEFDELRDILQKLDRSLDEAEHKRQHGSVSPTQPPHGVPSQTQSHATYPPASPTPTPVPVQPAIIPDPDHQIGESEPGRLKAKPLRRNRPENSGPSHGWVR